MHRPTTSRRSLKTATLLTVAGALTAGALAALVAPGAGGAAAQAAPVNTTEPAISGTPIEGGTLTATRGAWTGNPALTLQWRRCPSDGGEPDASNCDTIAGATETAYVVRGDDAGKRLRVRVRAENADGVTVAVSNATVAVRPASSRGVPRSTAEPVVSPATPVVGQVARSTTGEWAGEQPMTFAFQWLRCDANGNSCLTLVGANDDAYTVREGDAGKRLRVRVTASNDVGTSRRLSPATNPVSGQSGPPGAIKLPNGETSIPVSSVPSDARLIVDQVDFSPGVVRSRTEPITVRVKVKDTRGYVVRDAVVFVRSTPVVTSGGDEARTAQDGWLSYQLRPEPDFPELDPAYSVQFFVKAYRAGDPALAGVAGTRLVQVSLGRG